MPAQLKFVYNQKFFDQLTTAIQTVVPGFDAKNFNKQIFAAEWDHLELKQRMRHVSIVLHKHLSGDFPQKADALLKIIEQLKKNGYPSDRLELMFFPDFIEVYGLKHYDISIAAIEQITQFVTCEFAIRPFIIQQPEKAMPQMLAWSKHSHAMVRRLSSEGARPRLPWAMAIPALKNGPSPLIPILENLKQDESESVRRSVANNLNDISKDHPELVIALVRKWQGLSKETDWVVKHASRTLLKQGHPEVMALFGFGSVKNIAIHDFKIQTPKVKIGEYLSFDFKLINSNKKPTKIRLEYGLYYQKANGSLSKKVFSISEKEYAPNSTTHIERKQSFKIITTRKYHLGLHQVAMIINGVEFDKYDFALID